MATHPLRLLGAAAGEGDHGVGGDAHRSIRREHLLVLAGEPRHLDVGHSTLQTRT